ncbi:MAG: hypothetical protein K2O24_02525 [Muribaculaceae bacterium]|nr:hypothetical protein [Muribaculaceae bacterium]
MKKTLQMILLIAAGAAAGACLHECQSRGQLQPPEAQGYTVIDTVRYYDTIPCYLPVPKQEVSLGTRITFLPVFIPGDSSNAAQDIPQICNNDVQNIPDSVAVEIPITQKEYEGAEYHAWVSGYEPRLDSIFVFPRRDLVTIREPPIKPKRWGIGVFAGYGVTPHGLQPCAGISVNYNLWNF